MAPTGIFLLLLALGSSRAAVGSSQGAAASKLPNKRSGGWSVLLQKQAKLSAKVATEDPILNDSPDKAESEEVSEADEAGESSGEKQTLQMIQAVSMHQGAEHSLEPSDPPLPFPFELPAALTSGYTAVLEASSFLPPSSLTGALAYYKVDAEKVHLLLASNSGFAGFGMNFRGPSMRHADIVICQEHKAGSGEITAADYYAAEDAVPSLDTQDWVTVQGGRETMAPPPTVEPCVGGWTQFQGSCWRIFQTRATWVEAANYCHAEGGWLVTIRSEEQQAFVVQNFQCTDCAGMWIGLSKRGREDFYWHEDNSTPTYNNFASSSDSGQDFKCVFMMRETKEWAIGDCESPNFKFYTQSVGRMPYGCQRPVATQPEARPVTWCKIERSLTTCEKTKDVQLTDPSRTLYGLLAWSFPQTTTDALAYHGPTDRRVQAFSFSGEEPGTVAPMNERKTRRFTLSEPDVLVPPEAGSFVCTYHHLPIKWNRLYHILKYKAILDKESPSYVQGLQHHIDVNRCVRPLTGVSNGAQVSCADTMEFCSEIMLSGPEMYRSEGANLPYGVGIPIGPPCLWVVIRRHFYNPTRLPEVWDRGTKFEITYTKELRQSMRMLALGTNHIRIPAGETGSVVAALCPGVCTERLVSDTQVRRVAFHMNAHGRLGRLRHFRGGQELEPVAEVVPWDVVSQAFFEVNRIVKPGDSLKLECVYDNDLDTEITYGPSAEQEMCMATLTVVGPGKMQICSDLPWGWYDSTPGTECRKDNLENGKVLARRPECNFSKARTSCPDKYHPDDWRGATLITEKEHEEDFKPYVAPSSANCVSPRGGPKLVPAVPGKCPSPGASVPELVEEAKVMYGRELLFDSDQTDETADTFVAEAPTSGSVITGERYCGLGDTDFRVSWQTDCSSSTVTFHMEARGVENGWLAIGLLDAGTANNRTPMPATKMKGADIVQASIKSQSLRDAVGTGYVTSSLKTSPVAQFVSAVAENGKTAVKFTRPFDSPEGVSLTEEGFVYLICAVRTASDNFDAEASLARASKLRISLFGGTAESWEQKPFPREEDEDEGEGEDEDESESDEDESESDEDEDESEVDGESASEDVLKTEPAHAEPAEPCNLCGNLLLRSGKKIKGSDKKKFTCKTAQDQVLDKSGRKATCAQAQQSLRAQCCRSFRCLFCTSSQALQDSHFGGKSCAKHQELLGRKRGRKCNNAKKVWRPRCCA